MNTNSYIPLYHPPEERDFFTYLDDITYEKVMKDPNHFIRNARIINFDIIHHEYRGQPLENSYRYYQTLKENELHKYQVQPNDLLGAAFRNQDNTKQGIYFEKNIVNKHFKTPFPAAAKKVVSKKIFFLVLVKLKHGKIKPRNEKNFVR